MSKPVLKSEIKIRTTENGFVAVYESKEYIFATVKELNAWLISISAGG